MADDQLIEQIRQAFRRDDAAAVSAVLEAHPELKSRIDEPIGPFDSPAVTCVRSRQMLDALLAAGADINAKSCWWAGGFGLLHTAKPELAAYAIERGAVVDAHAAARLGLIDRLRELVSADSALVHAGGGDGQTPLHFASTVEIANCLLAVGADIDARDVDHESTPAQYMVRDRQELARFLVGRGCRCDILMASALGDIERVRQILDADGDAIRLRVSDEHFPMIGGRAGGTIYQWTLGWYVSAHQVAREFGHGDIFRLLMGRSPAEVRLLAACWLHDETMVSSLLAAEHSLASRLAPAEQRQLAHAARNNDLPAVRLMDRAGLPADARSQHGGTALHWAAFHGNPEMVDLILRRRPPLETEDPTYHATPLGWAIYGSQNAWDLSAADYPATVRTLLGAGAKPPAEASGSDEVRRVLTAWAG